MNEHVKCIFGVLRLVQFQSFLKKHLHYKHHFHSMPEQPHNYPKSWRCLILSHPICLQAPSQALSTTNKHVVVVKICAPRKFNFFAISSYGILKEVKHILVKLFILHNNKKIPLFHSYNFCILSCHIGVNMKITKPTRMAHEMVILFTNVITSFG